MNKRSFLVLTALALGVVFLFAVAYAAQQAPDNITMNSKVYKKHKKVLDRASGYKGAKSRRYRAANEQVMHAMQDAYRDRRARKGEFRRLWIQRINAAARQNGTNYSQLIGEHLAVDFDFGGLETG